MIRLGYNFDFYQLKTFLAVAETCNFSRAAKQIGRTQSAISLQIQRLEEIVGKPLFQRSNRKVELTAEGIVFLPYAKRMIHLSHELRSLFEEHEIEGEIRFGAPEDFATFYLPRVLAEFARSHPRTQLSVDCDLTLNLLERFDHGDYDIILVKREPSGIKTGTTVWHEPLEWVAADRTAVNDSILQLVLAPEPCLYRKRALAMLNKVHRPWRLAYTSPSYAGTLAAVRAGLGVTIMPKHMVPGDLCILKKSDGMPPLPDAEIALLARKELSKPAKIFAEHIMQSIP